MRESSVISSAVVSVLPGRLEAVAGALSSRPGVEVRAAEHNKIVVIIEGSTRDEVGGRLTGIALMDGVITANMVFEHVEETGDEHRQGDVNEEVRT
jgi:periplasmic nitrate reductase NapD